MTRPLGVLNKIKNNLSGKTPDRMKQEFQRFKMDMLRVMPFYGDILMRVTFIEDESIPTACTNGKNVRYNPEFMKTLNEGQRNYVLMHEVMHILLLHWKRIGERYPQLWNIACDYVVNGLLDRISWELGSNGVAFQKPPVGCFYKDYYRDQSAEEFYNILVNENKKKRATDKTKFRGRPVDGIADDLDLSNPLDTSEALSCEAEIKELIKETMKRRGFGIGPYYPRELKLITASKKLPWNRLLYEFMEERLEEESSYLTPERKYIHMDMIVPGVGKAEDELGEIWAFIDVSGSMSNEELGHFLTQLYRIASEFHCVFHIAYWHTEVDGVYKNIRNKEKLFKCKPKHSGGTDINCVYRYLAENKIKPGVLLILTDGYFGRVTEPLGSLPKKTIYVLSEQGSRDEIIEKYGKLARL